MEYNRFCDNVSPRMIEYLMEHKDGLTAAEIAILAIYNHSIHTGLPPTMDDFESVLDNLNEHGYL